MSTEKTEIAVLGAGLTGLAVAYFLGDAGKCAVYEKENSVGGLARSYRINGYTFDYTGHLLHLKKTENRFLINKLLKDNLLRIERDSAIYSFGTKIPFPFQVHLFALPPDIRRECFLEFVKAKIGAVKSPENFEDWIYKKFGKGIAKNFMVPYNEKMWRTKLSALSYEKYSRFIPQPTIDDVAAGALGLQKKKFGYNPEFFYPAEGGIGALTGALAEKINADIHLGHSALSVDCDKREIKFANGKRVIYDVLVSTAPLPKLVKMLEGAPKKIWGFGGKLRCVNVLNFNLGLKMKRPEASHWTYFPEEKFVFYRVGFPSNFAPALAPKNRSTAYIEISCPQTKKINARTLYRRTLDGLRRWLNIRESDVEVADAKRIEPAYVLFDGNYEKSSAAIRKFLERRGILSVGRYGQWDYLTMEDSFDIGRKIAKCFK